MSQISARLDSAFGPKQSRVVGQTSRSPGIQQLLQSMQSGFNQANQAGEQRYQQILGMFNNTQAGVMDDYSQALGQLANLGQSQSQMIDQNRLRQSGAANQGLISRGLSNTTVREGVQRGINRDAQQQQQALAEAVAAQKSGLLQNQAGARMGLGQLGIDTVLSKDDRALSDQYMQLLAQLL